MVLAQTTQPNWVEQAKGIAVGVAAVLTVLAVVTVPAAALLWRTITRAVQEAHSTADQAKATSDSNSQRITNVSQAQAAMEQTVTHLAANMTPPSIAKGGTGEGQK